MTDLKYHIITPVRNEAQHISHTISAVGAQTIRPTEWIIVNDGSTDRTGELINAAAVQHLWIRAIHRKDRGFREAGGGVMQAFYEGYHALRDSSWEFLVKLDGDLSFESDYFEQCFARFDENESLGIAGGIVYNMVDGELVVEGESEPLFHVRGATKIYRRACWDAIGALVQAPGWDTLDELKANQLGWETQTLRDLKLTHYRATGAADGHWKTWVKNGRANYITGYHPIFMLCKCVKRLLQKPFGIVSLGLMVGFFGGYIRRIPQVDDPALIRYVRVEQLKRLLFRKSIWG